MKNFFFICWALVALPVIGFGQWTNDGSTTSSSFSDTQVRIGDTGVGFTDAADYNSAASTSGAKFLVKDGILGHYVSGTVGSFSGKWCGLGIGNPGGSPNPYGLAIADAEELDKFFISFRNNENTNPFAAGNKLPVMTFQSNGRVGIGTLQPTSTPVRPKNRPSCST